jgi:hypothetical protein
VLRHTLTPRPDWQSLVEQQGLTFHTPEALPAGARPYWDESAAYEFTAAEVDTLEAAANQLQTMCLTAAQHVIDNQLYAQLEIPAEAIPLIEWAWNAEPPALYGRFDVLYDGSHPPKLLEYNADTPTSLLEAAVIQWYWLKDLDKSVCPNPDQFNSLHEALIAKWKDIDSCLEKPVTFASADFPEDILTLAYLRDTAEQAGLPTQQLLMQQIGWNQPRNAFVDLDENPIRSIFKLYPWSTGSSPSGSSCSPTKAFFPSSGSSFPTTTTSSKPASSTPPPAGSPLPAGSASRSTPAKAPTSPSSAPTARSFKPTAPTPTASRSTSASAPSSASPTPSPPPTQPAPHPALSLPHPATPLSVTPSSASG